MTFLQWVELTGTLMTIAALIGLLQWVSALRTLVSAQLTKNGGGSLLDKVNRFTGALDVLDRIEEQVNVNTTQMAANHEEAKNEWSGLHNEDNDVSQRLQNIETKLERAEVALPAAYKDMKDRVEHLEHEVSRIDRLEKEVFGD